MAVKLRVLHGKLRRQHGGSAGEEVKVRGERFVIGSGLDCQLRCPSSLISPHHCEIRPEQDRITIRDLSSDAGTFVNGERVGKSQPLHHGDLLRIGRLEFEVVMETPLPPPPPPRKADAVGDRISEMLVDADREARAQRFDDPSTRRFVSPQVSPSIPNAAADEMGKKRILPPKKSPPQKLPTPPRVVADTTVEAAEEVLKKFFERPKK